MKRPPDLLVHWEPRWRNFHDSLHLLFRRSAPKLPWEQRPRRNEYLSRICSAALHAAVIVFFVIPPLKTVTINYNRVPPARVDAFQISAYLPQLHDRAGAAAGKQGRSGGGASQRELQAIRVARGDRSSTQVFQAPEIKMLGATQIPADLLVASAPVPAPPAEALARSHAQIVMPKFEAAPPVVELPRTRAKIAIPDPLVVPPPPDVAFDQKVNLPAIKQKIVEPPPDISAMPNRAVPVLRAEVVPPPPKVPTDFHSRLELPHAVVAPPALSAGELAKSRRKQVRIPAPSIAPPAVEVGSLRPSAISGSAKTLGSFGAPAIAASAPSSHPGGASGVVVSRNPGSEIGVPAKGNSGELAMAPEGRNPNGIGHAGTGAGAEAGSGTGSGIAGLAPGTANAGNGNGEGDAPFGISVGDGSGGAGDGQSGAVPGVSISGGEVTLSSFGGSVPTVASPYSAHARVHDGSRVIPSVTVIGSSRAGGALNRYGTLKGGKVYTIYIDTRSGPAVLEFTDGRTEKTFQADLTPPEPLVTSPSPRLGRSPIVLSGRIDEKGVLRHVKVLESTSKLVAEELLAAIRNWRFRPVLRGGDAVAVEVLLGFGITTGE